jgi:nicotinamide mononucleotide transporter
MPPLIQWIADGLARNPLEVVAALFGVISVWLSTREHIASWPTAIVNVALYFVVFQRAKLYADMGLQVVYLALSVYGWYEWKFGGADRTELHVTRTSRRQAISLATLAVLFAAGLGLYLERHTDAALPWVDSAAVATSLAAQWMMTRKLLENWLVWVAVDVVYVVMFISKGLVITAVLYAIFLLLAAQGFFQWRRSWQAHASS